MTVRVVATVAEMILFVVVLGYFLNRVARQLNSIAATLAKVSWGVRAVETMCAVIDPAAELLNATLTQAAGGLEGAAAKAEKLTR